MLIGPLKKPLTFAPRPVPAKYLPLLVSENPKPKPARSEVSVFCYPPLPNKGFEKVKEVPKEIKKAFYKTSKEWIEEYGIQTVNNQEIQQYLDSALKLIVQNGHLILIKTKRGEIIGVGGLKYQKTISELIGSIVQEVGKVGILKEYRGFGFGKLLLKEILREAQKTTQPSLVGLETTTALGAACNLYEDLGFKDLMKELKRQLETISLENTQIKTLLEEIQAIFQVQTSQTYKEQPAPIFDKAEFTQILDKIKEQIGLNEPSITEKLIELLKTFVHPNTNLFMSVSVETLRQKAVARKIFGV